jgi:HAD superfamily hydrolase (TIGR01509 family)
MLEAVVFDFDGLILDTEMPEFTSWCEVFESHGHVLEFDDWARGIGTRDGFDPYALLEELTARTLDRETIRSVRRPRNLELLLNLPLMPGVLERLDEAKSLGLRVGLASSADSDWVCGHLERFALLDRFDALVCAGSTLAAKPYPAVYQRALADLGVLAGAAIAFEDSPNGIAAAKAAGVYCLAVPNELTSRLDLSAANERITSLADVSLEHLAARFTATERG